MYEDDDGQEDGDGEISGAGWRDRVVRFVPRTNLGLRSGTPPWHMWGNTQRLTTVVETVGQLRYGANTQLIKATYKRPETWHWLFKAKLISGPDNTAGFFTTLFVHWELIVGIGRTVIPLETQPTISFPMPGFDTYTFQWGPAGTAFPAGAQIFTTQTVSPSRNFSADGPFPAGSPVTEIVAQDIQLVCRLVALTVAGNVAAVGQPVEVEVSAQFAPKTHVRPDWFRKAPEEVQFPGAETAGQ